MSYERPYDGLKVLDFSQGVAGPYCGSLMALYGADVIKVEPPQGDWARKLGTDYNGHSVLDMCANRGKRSISLDMKHAEGRAVARALACETDVLIEGFRPGVADRLGIGYDEIKQSNPRVLYLSVSGYGQRGPMREEPCTDTVMQAFSGLMSVNPGNDGAPHRIGFLIVDMVTGLYAYQALATALHGRSGAKQGRHMDVSLMQSAAAIQAAKISEYALAGGEPRVLNAPAGTYRTSDGWIAITLVSHAHWVAICEGLELPQLLDDPRFADFETRAEHLQALVEILNDRLPQRTTSEWSARLVEAGGLCNAIHDFGDWLNHSQVQATDAAPTVQQPRVGGVPTSAIPGMIPLVSGDPRQLAPAVGEHGSEILRECGYDDAAIDALIANAALFVNE
ncbi:MAG: CoA transferase [Gammaproteobacteria bacterium]|jgi:crotonobetainyl-CoA:carnitine CoA-transferase CaiB-like acyl-CoA transferase|nr:CoA transferase [Gammaproteobacteria bacterium]